MSKVFNQASTSGHSGSNTGHGGHHSISNNPQITKKYRKITLDLILASTSLTRSSKETHEAYLQRVTHLHLQAKRIRKLEALELCTNLKVSSKASSSSIIVL
jgi:hypothetical protein